MQAWLKLRGKAAVIFDAVLSSHDEEYLDSGAVER